VRKSNFFLAMGIIFMVIGFVIAWPLVRAATMYSAVSAKVMTVLIIPVNETHSRVSIAYDYRVGGSAKGDIALGFNLVDERLQLVEDPIVTNDVARHTQRQLEGRSVRVYVDMNRPYDTAFMLNPLSEDQPVRPEQGALLVMLGIFCSILAQLTRLRR
jgi:hypothetical protein